MYNYYQQQQITPRPVQPNYGMLKGRQVSSLEEVRATTVDFDGTTFFFPAPAEKRIYTKAVDMNGNSVLNMYELKPLPNEPTGEVDFVTRKEFEQAMSKIAELLEQKTAAPTSYKEVF